MLEPINQEETHALSEFGFPIIFEADWLTNNRSSNFFIEGGNIRKLRLCGKFHTPLKNQLNLSKILPLISKMPALQELEIIRFDLINSVVITLNLPSIFRLKIINCDIEEDSLAWISELTSLTDLELNLNGIISLPDFFRNFSQLRSLNIADNCIEIFPEQIKSLKSLRQLSIEGNKLTEIPEWLGELSQLEVLNLQHNQIRELPESIGRIEKLKTLELSSNQLQSLPISICTLPNLEVLQIYNNQLESMPLILWEKLPKKSEFSLNKWKFPPWEIIHSSLEKILEYLRSYTPDVFLHNVETKLQSGTPLAREETHYPEILRLGAQLEDLCKKYPDSPTTKELQAILNECGYVGNPRHPHADTGILL